MRQGIPLETLLENRDLNVEKTLEPDSLDDKSTLRAKSRVVVQDHEKPGSQCRLSKAHN
jgi:hypothetical protein